MKKRILLFFGVIILIIGIALLLFRHTIIGHALKVSINKKTDQTISLKIGEVYYDIINSTVSFTDSELLFNNTFLNKDKTIELSQLKFDEIKIYDLSIIKLIFKREVIADKFTIAKPSLWFMENHNPKLFKEKPKEIINSLKQHHDILKDLTVIIGEVEITHGKIDLKSIINKKEHNGSVEFKLLLKKINTSKKQSFDEDKILFAEEHFVRLSNFNYTLPNGDKINFDSIVFDSKHNNLITSNLRVEINSGSANSKINSIVAQIDEILVSGINFEAIEDLHNIEFDSLAITDGRINITNNNSANHIVDSDTTTHKNNIFSKFHKLNFNSLVLNNIDLFNGSHEGDTLLYLKSFNFKVNDIQIDSASFASKIPNIDYSTISVSSGEVKVFDKKSGLKIMFDKLHFTEKSKLIMLADVQINDHGEKGRKSIISKIGAINISGISVQDIVNDKLIKVGFDISNPVVDLDLLKFSSNKSKKKKLNFDKVEISEIIIANGDIHIFEKDKIELDIDNLDFNSGNMQLTSFNKIHEINSDNFVLSTSSLKLNLIEKNMFVNANSIQILNNSFKITNISTNVNHNHKVNTSIIISQLAFDGINLKEIINDKIININNFKIVKPKINGSLVLGKNEAKKRNKSIDYKLNIIDFYIIKGDVDLDINLKQEHIKVKSGIDINIDSIYIVDFSDTTWLNELQWKVDLSNPVIHYQDYKIACRSINSDKANETLMLSNLAVYDKLNDKHKKGIDIRELSIESINISGLKYNTIIDKQTPIIKTISIQNPYFDIRIDGNNKKQVSRHGQINKKALPFDIEDIDINNLSFKIEKEDSISISNISLNNLNLKYNMSVRNDIFDGLSYFSVSDLLFSDTTKNSFASIKNISYSQQGKKITFSDIEGGNINRLEKVNYMQYASKGFEIIGINITQTFPHNISIEEIEFEDFDLNIKNNKKASSPKETKSKKKIQFPDLINSLSINEIVGNNIDVNHTSISDTSEKELSLNKLGFIISSINIDSSSFGNNEYTFVEKMSINLRENNFISKDSLYSTSINSIDYNFHKSELTIDTFLMKPRYEPDVFFKKAIYQIGIMDITTSRIVCSNIRFEKLISLGSMHTGSIDVYGLNMYIFKNKKYEINPDTYKKMPQELLLGVPRTLTIDSLKTHDSFIQYKQLSKKSIVPGIIFLDKVNLSVFNINNDLKVIDNTSSMLVFFNANLLGESAIDLKMTFPILSPSYNFWVIGHVAKIDFTKLNSMTQNLVGITLKKGFGELDIPLISGNSEHSQGSITFKYRKLKLELYDRDKAQNATGLGGNMANLLLNDILIKSNNPGFFRKTRTGEVYFKRDTQKSIVSYTWKSVLSGIMSTMGYNNKEQRQEKKTLKRANR